MMYNNIEYSGPKLIEVIFQQDDCLLTKLSEEYPLQLLPINEDVRKNDNKRYQSVTTEIRSLDNISPATYINKSINEGYIKQENLELLRTDGKNMVIRINTPFTELKSSYVTSLKKCLRVYPSLVSEGSEEWHFICEDEENGEVFIKDLSKLQHTKIVNLDIKKIPTLDLANRDELAMSVISDIYGRLSRGEKEILIYAFTHNYYRENRNIKLRDIASDVKKSKSFVSHELKRAEIKVMSSIVKLLQNYDQY